jgi:hypothetical protein
MNKKIKNNFFSTLTNSQILSTNPTKFLLVTYSNIKKMFILNLSRFNKSYLFAFVDSHIIHYPTPITFTYAWSFGSLAGICLVIQIISGVFFIDALYSKHRACF